MDWVRILPFLGLHLACLGVLWTGVSATALVVAAASYLIRMFALLAGYHRYFSHGAFRTGRLVQFLFAFFGAAATQRGPLWWAAHHRNHHRGADTVDDPHRPADGLFWSHVGWFLSGEHYYTDDEQVKEWSVYPELRWLNRFDVAVPTAYALAMFGLGWLLEVWAPGLGTDRWQLLVWGYFLSTIALTHATLLVNSMAHRVGARRFNTPDESRNNALIVLLGLGEGWHNNHHRYDRSARLGFYWWQIDLPYYGLRLLEWLGLVWDLRPVPNSILLEGRSPEAVRRARLARAGRAGPRPTDPGP